MDRAQVYETWNGSSTLPGDASDECRCRSTMDSTPVRKSWRSGIDTRLGVLTHQLLSSPLSPSSNGSGSLVLSEKIRVRLPVGTLFRHVVQWLRLLSDKQGTAVQFCPCRPRVVNAVGITIQTSGHGFEPRRSPKKPMEDVAQLVEHRSQNSLCVSLSSLSTT